MPWYVYEMCSTRPELSSACAHHIVHIFPVVEGDELERSQHGPEEVIKAGVAMVGILTHLQAEEP
jgi:hypothetical protein